MLLRSSGPLSDLEFYSVSTRLPEELRLDASDALRLLEEEIVGRFQVVSLPAGERRAFLQAAAREGVVGGRVYDAHIGEIARRAGSPLVLTDSPRHFASLTRQGVRVLTSADFAAEALD